MRVKNIDASDGWDVPGYFPNVCVVRMLDGWIVGSDGKKEMEIDDEDIYGAPL